MGHLTGTINSDEAERFKRLVFRTARGNALTVVEPMPQALTTFDNHRLNKSTYIVVF